MHKFVYSGLNLSMAVMTVMHQSSIGADSGVATNVDSTVPTVATVMAHWCENLRDCIILPK